MSMFKDIPVEVGVIFEGERIRRNDMQIELGGPTVKEKFELAKVRPMDAIEDGKITIIGPDLKDLKEGGAAGVKRTAINYAWDQLNERAAGLPEVVAQQYQYEQEVSISSTLRGGQEWVYRQTSLEEWRQLGQEWNQLDWGDRIRLMGTGTSKAAGLLAAAFGAGKLGAPAIESRVASIKGESAGVESVTNSKPLAKVPVPETTTTQAPPNGVKLPQISEAATKTPPEPSATGATSRGGAAPVRAGQFGEKVGSKVSGLPKNTRRIPSASGKKEFRIPDHMDEAGRFIQEDKAVKEQYRSSQLLDDKAYVLRGGYPGRVTVLIDEKTVINAPLLQEHLNPGSPIKLISTQMIEQK